MQDISEKEFEFTWKIENFTMCSLPEDKQLKSPIFVVDSWKKRKLQLWFYPRGWKTSEYVSCYLKVIEEETQSENTTIGCSFTVVGSEESSITEKSEHTLPNERTSGVQDLAVRDKILKGKNIYLPNDTLTIRYRMWIMDKESNSATADVYLRNKNILADMIFMTTSKMELEELKKHFSLNQCSAVTRIGVRRKSLVWPFKGIKALKPDYGLSIPVVSAMADDLSLVLTFNLAGKSAEDTNPNIQIRRIRRYQSKYMFVKCKITVSSFLKDVKMITKGEHFFKTNIEDVWSFPFSFTKKEFQKHLASSNDVLYLRCEFDYSQEGDEYQTANVDTSRFHYAIRPLINCSNKLGDEFKDVYKTGKLSDVTLRVGNRSFKTHKIILSTRSSVFRAIFEKEESGFVDIPDLDPDTLDRMLLFLYSDQLDELEAIDAVKLYTAADTYQVLSLKQRCSLFLVYFIRFKRVLSCKSSRFAP